MDELLAALDRYIEAKHAVVQAGGEETEADRKLYHSCRAEFTAAWDNYLKARIDEAVAAELEACAQYAKKMSMPDVSSIFRRRFSQ